MAWLAAQGFAVVGVEISPTACEAFFAEQQIVADKTPEPPFIRWYGEGVTIMQGDFLDLDATFAAALDRGALVAFPPEERPRYANHLLALLEPAAPLLVVTIEHDAGRRSGPPFPVFADEVRRLFPGAVEHSRGSLRRARWAAVGGADAVVWVARA
jgi:thiopurine S-methyltransferase